MITISHLFEALADEKVEKVEVSKNYIIQDLKDRPPESEIETYRRKVTYDKDGNKHIVNLAILKRLKKKNPEKVHVKEITKPEEM